MLWLEKARAIIGQYQAIKNRATGTVLMVNHF